ncbi:hypothetical protein BKA62DRAFT_775274 [Auriculariales sp. MPI-PUGE-AT-0066]|nr:hypothetical protein BKA62DRAFT_775274 [Auriculariales sp. MPI-PUGE-AT-0066]
MLSPNFQYAPQELVQYILQRTVQACIDPSSSRERAELAALALISRATRDLVIPVLYWMIEVQDNTTAVLLLRTLKARGEFWTARHVHALYIAPDDVSTEVAGNLVHEYMGMLFQCPVGVFRHFFPGLGPAAVSVAQDHQISLSYDPRLNFVEAMYICATSQLSQASHIHLGSHDAAHGSETAYLARLVSFLICEIDPASRVTHVALDWHNDAMHSAEQLRTLLTDLQTGEYHHPLHRIRRLVIHIPIWRTRDSKEEPSQDTVCDILERGVRESGMEFVAIHRVVLDVGSAREAYKIMAYEGWRRHAYGSEDLWLSGTPVLLD